MKQYNFDEVQPRKNTNSFKWDNVSYLYPDLNHEVLPMWIADMDFCTTKEVVADSIDIAKKGIFGYGTFDEAYYQSVKNWCLKRHNWKIEKDEHIVYSPSVLFSIGAMLRALTNEGDKIIIQTPVYSSFYTSIEANNRIVAKNPLIKEGAFYKMDYDHLESLAKDPQVKLMILTNPHNPVGRVWTKEELKKVIDICKRHHILVFSDEIHWDLVRPHVHHTTLATLDEDFAKEQLIQATSSSKTFNTAGYLISMMVVENDILRKKIVEDIMYKSGMNKPPVLGIVQVKAAYDKGANYVDELNQYLESNFIYMKEFFKENMPKMIYDVPEGTYLSWLNFENYDLSEKEIQNKMLNEANIATSPGSTFGSEAALCQRLNVACPRSVLEKACEQLYKAFK